jgi:hypothetical protein
MKDADKPRYAQIINDSFMGNRVINAPARHPLRGMISIQ